MSVNTSIEQQIREAFLAHQWLGSVPIEEAITSMIAYRQELNLQESALFNEELSAGRHPSLIAETVEIASGRKSSLSQARRRQVAHVS